VSYCSVHTVVSSATRISRGLEIVFSSNRPFDSYGQKSIVLQDVYRSTRHSTFQRWSPPVNLGDNVNSPGSKTRATMSSDRKRLYFGRDGDIYMSKRRHL